MSALIDLNNVNAAIDPVVKPERGPRIAALKSYGARWCPPALMPLARAMLRMLGVRDAIELSGRYATWDAALRQTTGFDTPIILARVAEATMKVLEGRAAFERDAVTFDEVQWPWPRLSGMARQAARDGELRVLDFGGALGGTFLTARKFFGDRVRLRWDIVEQPNYVHRAATLPFPPGIAFFDSIEAAVETSAPNVVIASGVLQHVPEPLDVLARLVAIGPGTLIIDRMPCFEEERDVVTVQRVPPSIYPASFPSWLFASERIPEAVQAAYREVARFNSGDRLGFEGRTIEHRGWIFERRD